LTGSEGEAMRHVTISMDDELLRKVELAADEAGLSLSEYISEKVAPQPKQAHRSPEEDAEIQRRLDLLQKVFDGPKFEISVNGRMPNSDERNAR
jgi:hypothetical protein